MGQIQGNIRIEAWFLYVVKYYGSESYGVLCDWCHCGDFDGSKYGHEDEHILDKAILQASGPLGENFDTLAAA